MSEPRKNRNIVYDSFLDPSIPRYEGPFTFTPKQRNGDPLKQLIQKAYWSGTGQINRTTKTFYDNSKYYQAKGICVRYPLRDYISWYINEAKKFPEMMWKELVCGRINHQDDYKFGNIQLETKNSNSLEVMQRYNNQLRKSLLKPVEMISLDGNVMHRFDSIQTCAKHIGLCPVTTRKIINSQPIRSKINYTLRFVDLNR